MALPTTVAARSGEPGYNPPHLYSGNVYVILQGATSNIECYKATDPVDGSFTEQDGANRPTVPNPTNMTSVQDGAKIHVAVYAPSSYSYARFDCSTDTWDTVGATGTDVIIESVSTKPPNQTWCSIAVDNTNVYIGYNGQTDQVMGGAKERADYAYRSKTATSGTFTTGIALDAAGDVHYANPVCVQSVNTPSDLIHFIWWRQTNTADPPVSWADFQARSSDNNVLQTTVTEAISPQNGLLTGIHNAVCYTDGGRDLVVVCAGLLDGTTRDLLTAVCDNNGTTDIITTVTDYYEALNVALRGETGVVSLAVDTTDSNKLYTVVGDATDADVGYATSTDNSNTWSSITDHVTAVSNEISANVYDRSGTKLAYVYDDNGTTKYHEIELGVPPFFPFHSYKDSVLKRY